jgi:ankyrin repeat protein
VKGDVAAARTALAAGEKLEEEWQQKTPLMCAAEAGHEDVLEVLLAAGARVDHASGHDGEWTALRYAARAGQAAMVERLLSAGADASIGADSWEGSLAHLAARRADTSVVELLARHNLPLDLDSQKVGGTPLCVAAYGNNENVVAALLAHGARIDARGELGRTALHLAAQAGHAKVVRLLLDHGAQRELADRLGRNPVHLACEEGHDNVIDALSWDAALRDWSPSLFRADAHGWTPLAVASALGRARCVQALRTPAEMLELRNDATLRTALHWRAAAET